jgi:outer membrane protein assembly factor BamB
MNGYVVTITHPDGTTEKVNLQSYVADGTSWFNYQPTSVGTYQFQFSFPGEYFAAGYYNNGNYSATQVSGWLFYPSDYVVPVTTSITNVTVQQAQVMSWSSALPNDYWSRPIEPNNREWSTISGNYPWMSYNGFAQSATSSNYLGPYIPAVNTPHILWSQVSQMSGIIGGEVGNQANVVGPSSSGTANTPSVIYMGRCYTTVTKVMPALVNGTYRQTPQTVAECYDLQTGKIYYDIPTADGGVTPTHISYWAGTDTSVPGAAADAAYGIDLSAISGSATAARLYRINPDTGAITFNASLPNLGSAGSAELAYYNGYYLSLQFVNYTTLVFQGNTYNIATNGFVINWTEQGSSTTFSSRIVSNISVSIPPGYRVPPTPAAAQSLLGSYDPVTGIGVIASRFYYGDLYGGNLLAIDYTTGKVLWNITSSPNDENGTTPFNPATAVSENGMYLCYFEKGYWKAYDLHTGALLWTTTINDYPWGEFTQYTAAGYNGILYMIGYTGVWALNETTGTILWHYVDPAPPFETPYTSYENGTTYANEYSTNEIKVIGGLVYISNNEHTPTLPPERGWGLFCLNATTGEFQWKISGTRMVVAAASDGYFVAGSNYDGKLYVVGKGPSTTTVSAPQTQITTGEKATISGTVLDESPAQQGTPAIADKYMDTWMDYLDLQMPIDGIYHNITVTGVPVSIDAVDPNGNPVHLGDTTSDIRGSFHFTWTPTMAGDYQISATFAGSNAYGSSSADTYSTVVNAPTPTVTPTATSSNLATTTDLMTYVVVVGIAIIIAIAVATILILRKH